MTYVVEKHDPYAVHPHLTDEEWPCRSALQAAQRFESEVSPLGLTLPMTLSELLSAGEIRIARRA